MKLSPQMNNAFVSLCSFVQYLHVRFAVIQPIVYHWTLCLWKHGLSSFVVYHFIWSGDSHR